jgi:DNA-binding transcriptional MocR family regulator
MAPAGTVDLASGNPDPALLPPIRTATGGLPDVSALYGDPPDTTLLAFAAGEFEADGIPARSMAVLGGALDAIERVLREYLSPGDRVAIEDPGAPALADLIRASGLEPVGCAIDENGPVPASLDAALRSGCAAAVVTPRAQNPTGAALTGDRAGELRRLVRRFPDVMLVENDHSAPIAGVPADMLGGGPHRRWVVIRSTSKFLGPDLRVAIMAGDDLTIARVRRRQALGARWVSHILQKLALGLWADPSNTRRITRAAAIYAQRRNSVQAALASRGITIRPRSGFNIWVPVHDEGHALRALADRGWAVAAGERFRMNTPPAIRITTSTLDSADAGLLADAVVEAARPVAGWPA